MEPFKATASNEQQQATREAIESLVEDMSFNSSIHFESSPTKFSKRKRNNQQVNKNNAIETTVLLVSNGLLRNIIDYASA